MTKVLKFIPNSITLLRMMGTVVLLFTKPMTSLFFVIYTLTGITDVLDGFIARKFKLTSEFGARLDSAADLLFYAVMILMILPILISELPQILWILIGISVLFRIITYFVIAIKTKAFAATHSVFNKITGLCVFLVPFVLRLPFSVYVFWVICILAFLSSLFELLNSFKINHL